MATKKQIAEQAMRILSGGNIKPDASWDIREFMLHLDQIRDNSIQEMVWALVKQGDYHLDDSFLSFYESVTVSNDGVKGLDYIELPAQALQLPRGLGIYQISPTDDMEDAFIMVSPGQVGLLANSSALENPDNTYCWPVGGRVYFKNLFGSPASVTVLMVASSKDIAEDAEYPMPPDMEAEALRMLVEMFDVQRQIPHDEAEDGIK